MALPPRAVWAFPFPSPLKGSSPQSTQTRAYASSSSLSSFGLSGMAALRGGNMFRASVGGAKCCWSATEMGTSSPGSSQGPFCKRWLECTIPECITFSEMVKNELYGRINITSQYGFPWTTELCGAYTWPSGEKPSQILFRSFRAN